MYVDSSFFAFVSLYTATVLTLPPQLPYNLWEEDILQTNMTLLFPQRERPISISTFATCFPTFDQVYGALDSAVHFKEVVIEGSNAPISFDVCSLVLPLERIQTANNRTGNACPDACR